MEQIITERLHDITFVLMSILIVLGISVIFITSVLVSIHDTLKEIAARQERS